MYGIGIGAVFDTLIWEHVSLVTYCLLIDCVGVRTMAREAQTPQLELCGRRGYLDEVAARQIAGVTSCGTESIVVLSAEAGAGLAGEGPSVSEHRSPTI